MTDHGAASRNAVRGREEYTAFISYSHYDHEAVRKLHRRLEHYRIPPRIVRSRRIGKTLRPIFLDRADYRSAPNYGIETSQTLQRAKALIVVCSPLAARSTAVDDEIIQFKKLGRGHRVFPIILSGEPNATVRGRSEDECFPPSLRFGLGADGRLTDEPINPIAADLRPQGDGPTDGFLKLVAGLLEVPFDEFKRRHVQAKRRRLIAYGLAAACVVLVAAGGLYVSNTVETRIATLRAAQQAAEGGQYERAGRLALASIGSGGALVPWSPQGIEAVLREAGARSSAQIRGGGCAPEDVAPDQPCFAGDVRRSEDGRVLAAAVDNGTGRGLVRLASITTGEQLGEITMSPAPSHLALSRDGALLAAAGTDHVEVFGFAGVPVASRRFDGELKAIGVASADRFIAVREASIAQLRREGSSLVEEASLPVAPFLTATPAESGRWVLLRAGSGARLVGPFVASGAPAALPLSIQGRISRWAFSPDGSLLAAVVNDPMGSRFYVVETGSRTVSPPVAGRHRIMTAIGLSGDGHLLITGGIDRKIRVWRTGANAPAAVFDAPFEKAAWAGLSQDGSYAAAFDERDENADTLYAWRVAEPSRRLALRGHARTIRQAFFAAGDRLVTAFDDASIRFWDLQSAFAMLDLFRTDAVAALTAVCSQAAGPYAPYTHPSPQPEALVLCPFRRAARDS